MTRKRSFPLIYEVVNGNRIKWQNPSVPSTLNTFSGVPDFISHLYLFYDSSKPNGWDYIADDSMKLSFRFLYAISKCEQALKK